MKSGDTYRFSLSWPMLTEEQIAAGEFLDKLGNRKSKFIVQLVCDYLKEYPEIMGPKETIQFILSSTPLGDRLADAIRAIIKNEFADKIISVQTPEKPTGRQQAVDAFENIGDMLSNLDVWNP